MFAPHSRAQNSADLKEGIFVEDDDTADKIIDAEHEDHNQEILSDSKAGGRSAC